MILKLWIYRLRRTRFRLIYNSNPRLSPRPISTIRGRSPNSNSSRLPNSSASLCRRRASLLSCSSPRSKNRRSPRTIKPNCLHCITCWSFLWPMLRDLRSKPQLHTYRSWSRPSAILWRVILLNTSRLIAKKLNGEQRQPFKLKNGGNQSPLATCHNSTLTHDWKL